MTEKHFQFQLNKQTFVAIILLKIVNMDATFINLHADYSEN